MYNLNSIGHKYLDGYKELTDHKDPVRFDPNLVFIPAVDNKGLALKDMLLIGTQVKRGTVLGWRTDFSFPILSSVSGTIKETRKEFNSFLGRPSDFFVIENDKKYDFVKHSPLKDTMSPEEFVEAIKNAGTVGMGGAGFPTYLKYKTDSKLEYLLVNDVECEPYLTTDYLATKNRLASIIAGAESIVKIFQLQKAFICIKKTKKELVEILTRALENHPTLELKTVPDVYPAGFERQLIKLVLKKEYDILPSEVGAVVNNVETIAEIGDLFLTGETTYLRTFTLAGDGLKESVNVTAPYGTMIDEIIEHIGGFSGENIVALLGGPMMGKPLRILNIPLFKYNSGVTVYKLESLENSYHPVACWHCGKCVDVCPVNLQPVLIRMALNRQDHETADRLGILSCVSCGLCSAACPSHIDLAQDITKGKMLVRLKTASTPVKK